ncbi:MAG: hypothetical protein LC800_10175 [Acidobacteria bacterium]|nr:hypothetical protein [Acidobacteriota bacterium]
MQMQARLRDERLWILSGDFGEFFFVWTLIALGVTTLFSVILSARGLWSLRRGQPR